MSRRLSARERIGCIGLALIDAAMLAAVVAMFVLAGKGC